MLRITYALVFGVFETVRWIDGLLADNVLSQ